jgi:hypothetical protein
MSLLRCLIVSLVGLCGASAVAPGLAATFSSQSDADAASQQGLVLRDLLLLGGDLSDDNYGGGGVRADGALHHIAEGQYVAGAGWWVMACRGDGCRLDAVDLVVIPAAHATYDGPEVPGQRLSLKPDPSAEDHLRRAPSTTEEKYRQRTTDDVVILAAFKPTDSLAGLSLQPGPLTTWWYSQPRTHEPGGKPYSHNLLPAAERLIRIGEDQFLTLRQQPGGEPGVPEVQLQIEFDGVVQSLGTYNVHLGDPSQPTELSEVLQWVGDLDGDGRPDLLINHSAYFWDVALYLSSLAKPGEVVGEAGRFTYSPPDSAGC